MRVRSSQIKAVLSGQLRLLKTCVAWLKAPVPPHLFLAAVLAAGLVFKVTGNFQTSSGYQPSLAVMQAQSALPAIERLAETASIGVPGVSPVAVAVTPDGARLCVVRAISAVDGPAGILLVSTADRRVLGSLTLPEPGIPSQAVVSPDGTRCYLGITRASGGTVTPGRNRVDSIDITTNTPRFDRSITVPSPSNFGPVGLAVNASGTRIYVADRGAAAVHVIDTAVASPTRFQVLASVSTAGDAIGVAVTPDGSRVYAANRSQSTVACIDGTTHALGGPACRGVSAIRVSVGPSGALADVAIAPDGKRAYAVYSLGTACISVIDIDPASGTFQREIGVISTTGSRLDSLALDATGTRLAVLSGGTEELLFINTTTRSQEQRISVGRGPVDVAFDVSGRTAAYVSNAGSQTVSIVSRAQGSFLRPDAADERTGDVLIDNLNPSSSCQPTPRNGEPGIALDNRLALSREANIIRGLNPLNRDLVLECVLSDPHPVTGQYQTCTIKPPQPAGQKSQGLWAKAKNLFAVAATKHIITVDPYDGQFRPSGFLVETEVGDTVLESRASTADQNRDGITDVFNVNALSFFPAVGITPPGFDTNQDGTKDYAGFPYTIQGYKVFLPLGDTNGDGIPDATAFDFDHDGETDPDLPFFPFLSGPANPQVELKLHFAQFGNGSAGGTDIASQILLFDLDRERPANVRVVLKDDQGRPLTVVVNGQSVSGETSLVIPPGGLRSLQTDGRGPLTVGSVTVFSDRAVAGVILFSGNGGLAGVGPSHILAGGFAAQMEVNSQATVNTGIAVMNLEKNETTLQLLLADPEDKVLATGQLAIAAQGHRALFVTEVNWRPVEGTRLDFSRFSGLLKATSSGKVTATVIQTRPGDLSTMPVAPRFDTSTSGVAKLQDGAGKAATGDDATLDQKLYFAQFGNGALGNYQISSQIILFNLTGQPATARLSLRDDRGNALIAVLNGESVNGQKDVVIPAGGLRTFQSDARGGLQAGSVTVASNRALAGTILFAASDGVAGVGSSSILRRGLEAPIQTSATEGINTGIAVMNLEGRTITFQLRLFGVDGNLLATADLLVPALGHTALFVDQVRWQTTGGGSLDFSKFSGMLKSSVSGKAAATVIQTRPGVLATQPAVPSLN